MSDMSEDQDLEVTESLQTETDLEGFALSVCEALLEDERVSDVIPYFVGGVVEQFSVMLDTHYGQIGISLAMTEFAAFENSPYEDLVDHCGQLLTDIITANEPVFDPGYNSTRVQTVTDLAADYADDETNALWQEYNQISWNQNSVEYHLLWLELYRRQQVG